jgi:hypothetical protein
MKSAISDKLHDTGGEGSAGTQPSVRSIRSNSKSSGSSVTTSTATTTRKHNSKKDKPLNETPEERERRKKEKRQMKKKEKKERKEVKEHETPEERAKRKEKRKITTKVSSTSTGITSPRSVTAEATSTPSLTDETPEERSRRRKVKKEKKQRKKEKKEAASASNKSKTSSSPKDSSGKIDPVASTPKQEPSPSSSVSTPIKTNVLPSRTKKADQRFSDISSFHSLGEAADISSSNESSDHGDKMSVSSKTDPYFGPQQTKSDQQRSFLLHQQYQLQLQQQYQQQQYQQQQEMQQMEQHEQYRQQLPSLQQHFQQAVPYTNRAISDSDYSQHVYVGTPGFNGSIGPKGMLVDPNTAYTVKSVMDDMSVCIDDETNSVYSGFTENTMEVTLHQQKFLLRMVKTMGHKVEKAEAKIRSLTERNSRMEDLSEQLTKSEEQLEYASEDNNDYSARVRALESALLMQETELDNALETIRLQGEARKDRELRKAKLEAKTSTNPFAEETSTNPFAEETSTNPFAEETNTNPFAEEATTNPFAGEDDEQLATREEVAAIREELAQLQQERDMAVERVTTVAMQLAELRADADESRDQLTETQALIERLQAARQQSSSNSIGTFFRAKKDAKSVMSVAADEAIDGSEDNSSGSVTSVAWPHSDHSGDVAYEVGRRHDEASYDLVL